MIRKYICNLWYMILFGVFLPTTDCPPSAIMLLQYVAPCQSQDYLIVHVHVRDCGLRKKKKCHCQPQMISRMSVPLVNNSINIWLVYILSQGNMGNQISVFPHTKIKHIRSSAFIFPILPPSQSHSCTSYTQPFPSVHTMCVSVKTGSSVNVKMWWLDIHIQLAKVTSSPKFGITEQVRSLRQHVTLTSQISEHHSVHAPSPSIDLYWIWQKSINSFLN